MQYILTHISLTIAITVIALSSAAASAAGKLPEVSPDGLKLTKQDKYAAVYLKDDAAFGDYDKLAILDCTVEFRKNWQRDQNEDLPFSVKNSDVARIKTALAAEFSKVFSQELTARGETVVTEGGTDVLVLRPAIINLDISVPDAMARVDEVTLTTSAGQMTLYMELYDSTTNVLLARVIDPEESRDFGSFAVRNEVTNMADANRILKKWADTLGDFLIQARSANSDHTP